MLEFLLYSYTLSIGFLALCYFQFKRSKNLKPQKNGIMIVFGSGGHTGEMLSLIKKINFKEFKKVYFVKAFSDNVSKDKVEDFIKKNKIEIDNEQVEWINIPRSRQVKQSFASSILTTLSSIIYCLIKVIKIKQIDILLCNGPGLCLPIVVSVLINKVNDETNLALLIIFFFYQNSIQCSIEDQKSSSLRAGVELKLFLSLVFSIMGRISLIKPQDRIHWLAHLRKLEKVAQIHKAVNLINKKHINSLGIF